ncbi:hypothetical protein [Ponticoccus litoralis]|uniref:Uncharacterized protein n=1 Tax=Ponticoccus litoralis TaxID=422297 RepID=A0AAW9S908_9RHOB
MAARLRTGLARPVARRHAGAATVTGGLAGLCGFLHHGAPSLAEAAMTARAARLGATVTLQAALIAGLMAIPTPRWWRGRRAGRGPPRRGCSLGRTQPLY